MVDLCVDLLQELLIFTVDVFFNSRFSTFRQGLLAKKTSIGPSMPVQSKTFPRPLSQLGVVFQRFNCGRNNSSPQEV